MKILRVQRSIGFGVLVIRSGNSVRRANRILEEDVD